MSHCPCAQLLMWPIAHVPHTLLPCRSRKEHATLPIYPITHCFPSLMCQITLPLVLMCPIAHVSHCSCGLLSIHPITLLPCRSRRAHAHCPYAPSPIFPWVMGTQVMGQQNVKWCQVVKRCQMSKIKYLDYGGGSQKKIDIMRFTHIDVNFDVTYDGNKYLQDVVESIFGQFWWPSYLTSNLTSISICKPH